MNGKRTYSGDLGWGLGGALVLHVVMVALAVAWVAFYSHVLEPGHDRSFYEAYAQRASPIVSLLAGGPVFFLTAAWLTRRRGSGRAAWSATPLYLISDWALLIAIGGLAGPIVLVAAAGAALKVGGTLLGIRWARR